MMNKSLNIQMDTRVVLELNDGCARVWIKIDLGEFEIEQCILTTTNTPGPRGRLYRIVLDFFDDREEATYEDFQKFMSIFMSEMAGSVNLHRGINE